jgi:hypothetical protein
MLTIENIGDLKGAVLANWKVLDAGEDNRPKYGKNTYIITFARIDNIGVINIGVMQDDRAGVIIDRDINPLLKGYDITIVYESWDYELHKTAWSKENIMNKNAFFGMVLHKINEEYYKRK